MRLTPDVRALIADVGLGDEVLTASGELSLFVFRKGRLSQAPLSIRQAFTTDLLTWTEKARVLLEPLTAGLREGETAGKFFRRKLGGAKTVEQWKRERFEATYPGYTCNVLRADGRIAVGQTSLQTVRNSYI